MQWVTIGDLLDPRTRLDREKQHLKMCIAQAQFEQSDRHHMERLQVENMRIYADKEKTQTLVEQSDRHHRERLQVENMKMYADKEKTQTLVEQSNRHHADKIQLENMKLNAKARAEEMQAVAIIEKEKIAGWNALYLADKNHSHALELADKNHSHAISLANTNHFLGQLTQGSQLLDAMIHSQLKQEENWNNTIADTMRQLFISEADTIKQERLKELDHKHKIESMTLEYNLRFTELALQNELQNARVSYDKTCEVIFKLIERVLGLGERYASQEDISSWVNEAMGQAYK